MEVKNSVKPVDYIESIKILEKRAEDVHNGIKDELLWILEHNTVYTAGTSYKKARKLNVTMETKPHAGRAVVGELSVSHLHRV